MHEILPCPRNPKLLCVPGVCGNNADINVIHGALDTATVPAISKAREEGLETEEGVVAFVKNDPNYKRAAAIAEEALEKLDLNECAPLACVPSAS